MGARVHRHRQICTCKHAHFTFLQRMQVNMGNVKKSISFPSFIFQAAGASPVYVMMLPLCHYLQVSLSLCLFRLLILIPLLPTCYAPPSTRQQERGRLAGSQPWRQANCLQQHSPDHNAATTATQVLLAEAALAKLSLWGEPGERGAHASERAGRARASAGCSVRTDASRCTRQRASSAAQHTGSLIRASFQDCLMN